MNDLVDLNRPSGHNRMLNFSKGISKGVPGANKVEVFDDLGDYVYRRQRMEFFTDFMETAALLAATSENYRWTLGGTSGTAAIIAAANGVMQLDTTATGSRSATLTFSVADFSSAYEMVFEARIKTDALTERKIEVGWYVDGNDCLMFRFDSAVHASNLYLVSENNNGGEKVYDTGVDLVGGSYIVLRIEVDANLAIKAFVNGVRVLRSFPGTIRSLATFKPWFYIDNKAAAQSNKLDIDYAFMSQKR